MVEYAVIGVLGIVVGRVTTIDDVVSTVRSQMNMSDKVESKLRNKLNNITCGQVHVDYYGASCTVLVESKV